MNSKKITILGAGCWGMALGSLLKNNGYKIMIWDINKTLIEKLKISGKHPNLKDISYKDSGYIFTNEIKTALEFSDLIFTVIPAQNYKEFCLKIKPYVNNRKALVSCSKGIDYKTNNLISEVIYKNLPQLPKNHFFVLSGPSYAHEVIKKIPTAVTLAGKSKFLLHTIQEILCNDWFRVYTNNDITGVELAGAIKNVIAIASGITKGIGYGSNTQAALITRGNAEIKRLGKCIGAREKTFNGLSGIGDLILTATSEQSRNYLFGKYIGEGMSFSSAKNKISTIIEGIETVKAVKKMSAKFKIEMPICNSIYKILFKNANPGNTVKMLMKRDLKSE